jgi:predicted PilT family ATPase
VSQFLQASVSIPIPKEHHRFILGKSGTKLKDLEKTTATKITVPNMADSSDKITITGTKEGIEKAVHEIKVTSDEQVDTKCYWKSELMQK